MTIVYLRIGIVLSVYDQVVMIVSKIKDLKQISYFLLPLMMRKARSNFDF
jgi:hypothetical protein